MDESKIVKKLSPAQKAVLMHKATEPPFSGELLDNNQDGGYYCAACGNLLFDSSTKFDSNSGWPSFNFPVSNTAVELVEDLSEGMHRIEVRCSNCHGHLGHVFNDAPDQPTGMTFCINSLSLDFKEED
jgi:peptide-methionine (R)-S-oxide reductase